MEKVVIFGASRLGEIAYNVLKNKYYIQYFLDNDSKKWGTVFCDKKICSVEELRGNIDVKIIIASVYYSEISIQLKNMGIRDIYIFSYSDMNDKTYKKRYSIDKMADLSIFNNIYIDNELKNKLKSDCEPICSTYKKKFNKKKNVLIIAYFFPPIGGSGVQRTLKFVKYLKKFNWNPIVITVGSDFQQYDLDYSLLEELPNDVKIIRFDHFKFCSEQLNNIEAQEIFNIIYGLIGDESLADEFLNSIKKNECSNRSFILEPDIYIGWVNDVLRNIDNYVDLNNIDAILTTSGPYSDHIIGYYLKKKYKNIKWVADFRDEWTNNPYSTEDKKSLKYRLENMMESNIIKTADKIIQVTPISEKNCRENFNIPERKVTTITNGYDESDFNNIIINSNNKNFTVTYAGTVYYNRFPEGFIKSFNELIDENLIKKEDIKINFYGIYDWRITEKISNLDKYNIITCYDYVSHEECLRINCNSNLLFLPVGKEEKFKGVYTGKVFEYIKCGVPILALSPKESIVEDIIKRTNTGMNFEYDDIEGMKKYILEKYRQWQNKDIILNANLQEIKKYDRIILTQKLAEVFDNLMK